MKYQIIHRYANDSVVSRHRSQNTAEKALDRLLRLFRRSNPASGNTRPIFPYSIREVA